MLNDNFNNILNPIQHDVFNRMNLIQNSSSCMIPRCSFLKKGNKIKIKEKNKGSFTKYCGGNVTSECIRKGKNSPNPKIRKKAIFADNSRKWKHAFGGVISINNVDELNKLLNNLQTNV